MRLIATAALVATTAFGFNTPALARPATSATQAALNAAGVIFVAENGEGPGVRLRKGVGP